MQPDESSPAHERPEEKQHPTKTAGLTDTKALGQKFLASLKFSTLRKRSWRTKASLFLVLAAIISSFATYAALTETPPFGNDPRTVITLLNIDLIFLLLLVALIAKRIVAIWSGRKRGIAGSHLHVRLVYIFSFLAAVPTIIMTVFSAFFFHFGVQTWFSEHVKTAINESLAVAESYLEEHQQVIRADTMAMAADLDRQADIFLAKPKALEAIMETQSQIRNLPEAIIFQKNGHVIARSSLTISLAFENVPSYALNEAEQGDVVLMLGEKKDRVRALVKLQNFEDSYLFVGRMVDSKVLAHLSSTAAAVEDYSDLQASYAGLQITVTMLFVVVGLLMLLAAIWLSLVLARELVMPISELISTSDRVRSGDLTARVPEEKSFEEFEYLAKSFNRMTQQIQQQRDELISANRQIDLRRRLTESVLKGVSSGVIGLDESGNINLSNASADLLLSQKSDITGRHIFDVLPELKDLLERAYSRPGKITQQEIILESQEKEASGRRIFLFRASLEPLAEQQKGIILTFDDITEFQSAQRKAAWSDVARRIAHEIKNPLTPIQLSAERLKRKYLGQIHEDKETFTTCTETIIRHVEDIGRMVDEFSSFARMPEPNLKEMSLVKEIRDALLLPQQAHSDIRITISVEPSCEKVRVELDAVQIRQVMNNLIQNSVDSIRTKLELDPSRQAEIRIVIARNTPDEIFVAVTDNGMGLPSGESPERLTEPYVTHKTKGTGLGLAIVKKIMEDHRGRLLLTVPEEFKKIKGWSELGGATLILTFPLKIETTHQAIKQEVA
ncbi:MAG: PAS domain-containing sensor histidine kinase [Alphaproteobacteria bacterium]|nr:PAS domain-containing sensor histidine kinase [Alphaproteobacteria bacterium]MBP7757715.1 PAS domain-containing sensor histidine kinase [Alphaproteobacteria bacterium]MBP7761085.1 PAS domain-containing sensor histidine kinase [Alphaproteobacteria bacterium]MBP7904695.1 PAS domain-containing sensor histidine kinase [Alphaproteobacteria bacterium]